MKTEFLSKVTPRIILNIESYKRFAQVLKVYDLEFTALTYAERLPKHVYRMWEIFFPVQTNDSVNTEYDAEAQIDLMVNEGCDISLLTGHIHSHVNMDVFSSGTDTQQIKRRAELGGYNVALIMNKSGKIFGHIADYDNGFYFTDVDVEIECNIAKEAYEAGILNHIKRNDLTMDEVKRLVNKPQLNYELENYSLSAEEILLLGDQIKSKFKTAPSRLYKINTLTTTNKNLPTKKIVDAEFEDWYEKYLRSEENWDNDNRDIYKDKRDSWEDVEEEEVDYKDLTSAKKDWGKSYKKNNRN